MANTIVASQNAPVNASKVQGGTRRYLSISAAAGYLGVSEQTMRRLTESGEVDSFRTAGNHRRVSMASLETYASGEPSQTNDCGGRILIVARVSSKKQAKPQGGSEKSSLQHQVDRLTEYVRQTYGRDPDETITSQGSGMNWSRPEFVQLLERMVTGQLKGARVVCQSPDRMCRFGSDLVSLLARIGGCEVEYMMSDETKTASESLADDILGILTFYTAKASAAKSRAFTKVSLSEEDLADAYKMKKQGQSYKKIEQEFAKQGRVSERGKAYSASVIRTNLNSAWETLEALSG